MLIMSPRAPRVILRYRWYSWYRKAGNYACAKSGESVLVRPLAGSIFQAELGMKKDWSPYAGEAIYAMMNGESTRSVNKRLGVPISRLEQWQNEFLDSLPKSCRRLVCRHQDLCAKLRLLQLRKRLFES